MSSRSRLEQLNSFGTVVAIDSCDFDAISKHNVQECTTNPSLVLSAINEPKNKELLDKAVQYGRMMGGFQQEKIEIALDALFVEVGCKILEHVPGRISTEVDARLSFDKKQTIKRALRIIKLYEEHGIQKERILIKIASTWEGIQAAQELEKVYGIHCNLTLLFSMVQAVTCGEAGVTLVSPFLGRITDFYEETENTFSEGIDPGIQLVKEIYFYFKATGYKTSVLGTCFRRDDQIMAVAGIDNITLPPDQLEIWESTYDRIERQLNATSLINLGHERHSYISDEAKFRFNMLKDEMATQKLAEGLRKFCLDNDAIQEIVERGFKPFQWRILKGPIILLAN